MAACASEHRKAVSAELIAHPRPRTEALGWHMWARGAARARQGWGLQGPGRWNPGHQQCPFCAETCRGSRESPDTEQAPG